MDNWADYESRRWYVFNKNVAMFKLFKKKTKKEKLTEQYSKLLEEAHHLSKIDRRRSDEKIAEAENIINQLNELE